MNTTPRIHAMDDAALERIAEYFRALSEPLRLKILNALRAGERNVTELTRETGTSQANASKHLATLLALGLVEKSVRGTSSYYRIADADIYGMCDFVCGQIGRKMAASEPLLRSFIPRPAPAPVPRARRAEPSRRRG